MWTIAIIAIVMLIVGLLVFIFFDPYVRNLGQDVFPDIVRKLLIRTESGGFSVREFINKRGILA